MWPSASMMGWPTSRRTSALVFNVNSLPLGCYQQLGDDLVESRSNLFSDDRIGAVDVVGGNHHQRDVGQPEDLGVGAGGGLERCGDERHRRDAPLFQVD